MNIKVQEIIMKERSKGTKPMKGLKRIINEVAKEFNIAKIEAGELVVQELKIMTGKN